MADELTIAIGGGGTLLSAIGGWILKAHNRRLEKMEQSAESNAKESLNIRADLADYKLDSEKRFAKEDTLQSSLARIHDRLDHTATKDDVKGIQDDVSGIQGDIKTLLARRP